ncbi:MAG: hypothetical protein L0154_07120 [Chloroflexi bacterium]|nr:hypothetical protein [Chloroflexota bacterium]
MAIERLETDFVSGYFAEDENILYVTYRHALTPSVTNSMYRWLGRIIKDAKNDISRSIGSIYDFSDVDNIDLADFMNAQVQSVSINVKIDLSKHPVALIVKSEHQEEYVRMLMGVTPQENRKRIVYSVDEAKSFIQEFHENLA